MESQKHAIEAGAWAGRQQAFAVIASKCSVAQALSLKQARESRAYEELGLTWEEYCPEYLGISRAQADHYIRQLNHHGETYYRLAEIARISPETYQRLAPAVAEGAIEIEGEKLALTPENAPKIRAALNTLRRQLRDSQSTRPRPSTSAVRLQTREESVLEEARRAAKSAPSPADREAIEAVARYALENWTAILALLKK
ncbi:MAG TPA: hypothetical protein VGF59_20475 [Bryobacteraceae bacterium]